MEIGDAEHQSPIPGARTARFRVLSEEWGTNQVKLAVEGLAGTVGDLKVRRHKLVKMKLEVADGLSNDADQDHPGASLSAIDTAFRDMNLPFALEFHFPPGEGWKTVTVTLTW